MIWISNSELGCLLMLPVGSGSSSQRDGAFTGNSVPNGNSSLPALFPLSPGSTRTAFPTKQLFQKSFSVLRISAQMWALQGQSSCCQYDGNTGTAVEPPQPHFGRTEEQEWSSIPRTHHHCRGCSAWDSLDAHWECQL